MAKQQKQRRRRTARRHDRGKIERLLAKRRREGLSYRQLSESSGIPAATLQWWAWRLRRDSDAKRRRDPDDVSLGFVELETAAPSRRDADPYEITLPNGRALSVSRGFDPEEVRVLINVLGREC